MKKLLLTILLVLALAIPAGAFPPIPIFHWDTGADLATDAETIAGAETGKAVTPANLTAAGCLRDFSTANHTATGSISEAQIKQNKWHTNNGASTEIDLTLPALSYTISIIFIVQETQIMEINPPSGELFDHDGTDLNADDCIDLSIVVGDKIAFTRMLLADGTTWRWSTDTIRGSHVDTGATD